MKRVLVIIGVLVALLVGMAFSGCTTEQKTGMVTYIAGDEVVCVTEDGEAWAFYGDGFNLRDVVNIEVKNGEVTDAYKVTTTSITLAR